MLRFAFLFVLFTQIGYSANTNLPNGDDGVDRQQRLGIAVNAAPFPLPYPPNPENFIEHVDRLHRPISVINAGLTAISDVALAPPPVDPNHLLGQSYFFTSDIGMIKFFIEKAIFYAQQNPIPGHTTLQRSAPLAANEMIITCDLALSGDINDHFVNLGGIGLNVPSGNLVTNTIAIFLKRTNTHGWRLKTAYPR